MPRTPEQSDATLIAALASVFRDHGYEGASLTKLAAASGLKRASLYHRFPRGKEEMAEEALAAHLKQVEEEVLSVLRGLGEPREKLDAAAVALAKLHAGGEAGSLINLFGVSDAVPTRLTQGVQAVVSAMISAVSRVLEEAGLPGDEARARGLRGVVLLEGALVVSRAIRDTAPFEATLARWPDELLEAEKPEANPAPAAPEATDKATGVNKPISIDVRRAVAAHLSSQRSS